MLTLYTSVGLLKIEKASGKHYPIVVNNGRAHSLDPGEMLIWSSLTFQFLTLEDAKLIFETNLENRGLNTSCSFEHYLRRLLFRRLIIKGDGLTQLDALYELLGSLYIVPLADNLGTRLFSSLHMVLKGQIPLRAVKQHMKPFTEKTPVEKLILQLARERAMSTAEFLHRFDKGQTLPAADSPTVIAADTEDMTCEELDAYIHAQYIQAPVLIALGNLYLQKRILFRTF